MKLEVTDLTCGYGDMRVVRNLNITANPGEVVALLGRNGAGKTTTLRAIAGLITIHTGSVTLDGQDLTRLPVYRRVKHHLAFVQEGKRIFRQRTVRENLILGAYTQRIGKAELNDRLERAYEAFPILGDFRQRPAGELSGGQQQMLAISQALMRNPKVVLFDEPSGGLAPSIVAEVYEVIAQLRTQGLTVVLVEQAAGWAASVADRFVILENGLKVDEGDMRHADAAAALDRIGLDSHSHVEG